MKKLNDNALELVSGGDWKSNARHAIDIAAIVSMPAGLALCAASCVCQYCAKSHREQGNVADAKTLEKTSRIFTDVGIGVLAVGTGSLIAGYVGAHCGGTPSTN